MTLQEELQNEIEHLDEEKLKILLVMARSWKDQDSEENIQARKDAEQGNTQKFDSVEDWWESINA